jgi:hypothetical protein
LLRRELDVSHSFELAPPDVRHGAPPPVQECTGNKGSAQVSLPYAQPAAEGTGRYRRKQCVLPQPRVANGLSPLLTSASPVLLRLAPHRRACRVLALEPVGRAPRAVARVLALRHDALQAHLAGMGEHGRAVGSMCSLRRRPGAVRFNSDANVALRTASARAAGRRRSARPGRRHRGRRPHRGGDSGCGRSSARRRRRRRPPRRR